MNPTHDRIAFMVRFAGLDLDRLRAGDWMNLRDDLAVFLHGRTVLTPEHARKLARIPDQLAADTAKRKVEAIIRSQGFLALNFGDGRGLERAVASGVVAIADEPPLPGDLTEQDFRELQKEVRTLFDMVVAISRMNGYGILSNLQPVTARYALMSTEKSGRTVQVISGATKDVAIITLVHMLAREDTSPVRRCPECKTIFLRVRRQQYCSRACVNRANKRAWRAGESRPRRRSRGASSRQPKRGDRS
jgi:hypothetical protein